MRRNRLYRNGFDAWSLWFEASSVIALRTLTIAAGGAKATAEMQRMVSEKIEAGMTLQAKALTGALGRTPETAVARTLSHYRGRVRRNRKRLTRDR